MSKEREEIKEIIRKQLKAYRVKENCFVPGQQRDTIIPIALLDVEDKPCLVIRIRLRDKQNQKETISKRVQSWERITRNQVITIWCREDAENIATTVKKIFFA
jgi:hypothetical protein